MKTRRKFLAVSGTLGLGLALSKSNAAQSFRVIMNNPASDVPGSAGNPELAVYESNIIAAGGSLSSGTKTAIDTFISSLKSAGLWAKIAEIGPFAGTGLAAALVKLKYPTGNQSSLSNTNFAAGDYAETGASGGLLGNGTSKFLNTGTTPAQIGATGHAAFYQREDFAAGTFRSLVSSYNTVDLFGLKRASGGSMNSGAWGKYDLAIEIANPIKGFYLVSRLAANNLRLYRDGSQIAQNTTSCSLSTHSNPFYLWANNNNGTAAEFLNCRGSYYSLGSGLTAGEVSSYRTIVQALQAALSRQI